MKRKQYTANDLKKLFSLSLPFEEALLTYEGGVLKIADATCSEISMLCLNEAKLKTDGGEVGKVLENLFGRMENGVKKALKYGSVGLKPFIKDGEVGVEIIPSVLFRIIRKSPSGKPLDTVFRSAKNCDGRYFERFERHILNGSTLEIKNYVLCDGKEGKLSDFDEWANLSPYVKINGVTDNLFSILSTSDGRPFFINGVSLIKECEKQFDRLLWEYEGGELAVDASEDAFKMGRDGNYIFPKGKERLFRTNMLDACSSQSELLKTFAPALRDESYLRGLNNLLLHYEDAVGIARGTFSDVTSIPKTATEVEMSRQRTFSKVEEMRRNIFSSLCKVSTAVCDLLKLYGKWSSGGGFELSYGDGVAEGSTIYTYHNGKVEEKQ